MGLVKFGAQTLSIVEIPDGHVVISDSELANLRLVNNSYLTLKASIPPGVEPSQVASILEKGQRYDSETKLRIEAERKTGELENQLKQFSNIPKEFKVEEWNRYVKQEQTAKRTAKVNELTQEVYKQVKEKNGVDISVDERFFPSNEVEAFDPFAQDANEKWYKIVEKAYDAQQEFITKQSGNFVPSAETVGSGGQPSGKKHPIDPRLAGPTGDKVSPEGGQVRTMFGPSSR